MDVLERPSVRKPLESHGLVRLDDGTGRKRRHRHKHGRAVGSIYDSTAFEAEGIEWVLLRDIGAECR